MPEISFTPRKETEKYSVQMNQSVVDILSVVFEFKLATSWQIGRFLAQKDNSKYLYLKLRRMWKAHLMESFKVPAGSAVYYTLSRNGLQELEKRGMSDTVQARRYSPLRAISSSGLFEHEAQVVELASMEARNSSASFGITMKGETSSGSFDIRSSNSIESFTPDYTALYTIGARTFRVYSEYERAPKSKSAMAAKLERYSRHLNQEERSQSTVRFIFQTPNMERLFWRNIMENNAAVLEKLKIVTTNVSLLKRPEHFLEPMYAWAGGIKLKKVGRLEVEIGDRVKLFSFL